MASWSPNSPDGASPFSLPAGLDLDILIVGKTGHGKSATGNAILGQKVFRSAAGTTSVTNVAQMYVNEVDGRKLLVVDTPGLCDTNAQDSKEAAQKALRDFSIALALSPEGFHAILLVFKFGERMTPEEVDVIKEMKSLLGNNFLRNHGVFLWTRGDDFECEIGERKLFKKWCEEQDGAVKEVIEECQHRIVLFNNRDASKWAQQRFELVQIIDRMADGKRYQEGMFKEIKAEWHQKGDDAKREAYLHCSKIFSDMYSKVTRETRYDKDFIYEMRLRMEQMKQATKDMTGSKRKQVDNLIKEAEANLIKMENEIKASSVGYITIDSPTAESLVNRLIDIPHIMLGVVLSGLIAAVELPVRAVVAIYGATLSAMTKSAKFAAKNCVLQ